MKNLRSWLCSVAVVGALSITAWADDETKSLPASPAIKKASELISDGCLNVEIVMPDGATYRRTEFEQLRERIAT